MRQKAKKNMDCNTLWIIRRKNCLCNDKINSGDSKEPEFHDDSKRSEGKEPEFHDDIDMNLIDRNLYQGSASCLTKLNKQDMKFDLLVVCAAELDPFPAKEREKEAFNSGRKGI